MGEGSRMQDKESSVERRVGGLLDQVTAERGWALCGNFSGDLLLVEGIPIVEVVEVDGIEDFPLIRDS
jgi:hypothetical protein